MEERVFEPLPEPEPEQRPAPVPETEEEEALRRARRDVRYGSLWCFGGLAFTLGSYWLAEEGGHYVVATGAVVWGMIQALRGVVNLLRIHRRRGDRAACRRTLLAALGAAVAAALLVWGAMRAAAGEEPAFLETAQTIDIPGLRLRATLPPGYTEAERTTTAETDSTFAVHKVSAWNARWGVTVEGIEGFLRADSVTCADQIVDLLHEQALGFLDEELIAGPETVEAEGIRMVRHRGRIAEYPAYIYTFYDLVHDGSLTTLYFWYASDAPDPALEREAAEAFFSALELY